MNNVFVNEFDTIHSKVIYVRAKSKFLWKNSCEIVFHA